MEEKPELSPSLSWTALGLLLAAAVIALAVWLVSLLWGPFAYRAGLAGTPGTLTAAHCHVTGSGKYSKRDCSGTFVASTGAFTDSSAHTYDVARFDDSPIRVQRRSDGGYTQPRADRVVRSGWCGLGVGVCGAGEATGCGTGRSADRSPAGSPSDRGCHGRSRRHRSRGPSVRVEAHPWGGGVPRLPEARAVWSRAQLGGATPELGFFLDWGTALGMAATHRK
ncbi:hypothetical protein GCM10010341_75740 [Streptomyces noursei]|nr:hypothetical protein GCM10010341_75740 [Streptomyces noursei]